MYIGCRGDVSIFTTPGLENVVSDRIRKSTRTIGKVEFTRSRKQHGCRGQSVIEFALVSITFFFLVFAIIDFSWALFNQMNVQEAVRQAGRYAATGRHITGSNGSTASRISSITQVLDSYAIGSGVSISSVTISSAAGGVGSAGGPGDTVTITATCAVPMLTTVIGKLFNQDGRYHFTASSTFRNEPFLPSDTN
jgi:Flp pilus assembly protein TadG